MSGRRGLRRPLVWLAATALLAACAAPPRDDGRAEALALADAEAAFAAAAATDGVRASFLGALADDAILFRPGPVDGKAYLSARPDPPVRLAWRSQRVAVAASGELGWSTGPFRVTAVAAPDRPAYGQFFTVWRKNATGRWQVLIDLGVDHRDPTGWETSLDVVPLDRGVRAFTADAAVPSSVAAAETAFALACDDGGPVAAYRAFGAERLRLLRDDTAPIDGPGRADALPDADARWSFTPGDSATARSGDLAWAMGRYRVDRGDRGAASGTYVRVWHTEGGRWKILGDVLAETARAKR